MSVETQVGAPISKNPLRQQSGRIFLSKKEKKFKRICRIGHKTQGMTICNPFLEKTRLALIDKNVNKI